MMKLGSRLRGNDGFQSFSPVKFTHRSQGEKSMKFVFAICLFLSASFAWAAEPHPSMQSESAVLEGKVIEVLNVEGFTYLDRKSVV